MEETPGICSRAPGGSCIASLRQMRCKALLHSVRHFKTLLIHSDFHFRILNQISNLKGFLYHHWL